MPRTVSSLSALGVIVLSALLGSDASAKQATESSKSRDRKAVLLAINDVYRIEGLEDGAVGGMPRVRALRLELEREAPDLLLLHGGDFLFPSFASRMYGGEQMVAAMNALDGDGEHFDPRMFVTFGNHEFDQRKLKDAPRLQQRIDGSQFQWLGGNFNFVKRPDGQPAIASKNMSRTAVVESGGIRIGIFGLTIPTLGIEYIEGFSGEQAAAREMIAELRAQKAEVIIALTHLSARDDEKLLESLGSDGPDLVIGGHDHESVRTQVNGRWVLKADAGARTATVVRLVKKADGTLRVTSELRPLGGASPSPDPKLQLLVDRWQERQERAFCSGVKAGPQCLDEVYGRTRTALGAEEIKIRGAETSLGDWITDRMIAAFHACGADAALINSGALRINRDLPAGVLIKRRHVEELIAYETPLYLLRIDGATLMQAANQAVRGWPGNGSWLQVGGFAFRHDQKAKAARDLTRLNGTARPLAPNDSISVVVPDYLINSEIGDQDGYQMLGKGQVDSACGTNGIDLKDIVIRDLKAAEPLGIAPKVEGRICQGAPNAPCLVPAK